LMPNLTPPQYRALYEIYPGKACIAETAEACHGCLLGRFHKIGRHTGRGAGGRRDRINAGSVTREELVHA
jgi:biotin synthase